MKKTYHVSWILKKAKHIWAESYFMHHKSRGSKHGEECNRRETLEMTGYKTKETTGSVM